jgi:hypothetical protein
MQAYGNVASLPQRKISKTLNRGYFEFRMAESQRTSPLAEKTGSKSQPCWYTVRIMLDKDPELELGNFVRATGALKVDSYIGRDGKPASGLVLIAFDVYKVEKDLASDTDDTHGLPAAPKKESKGQQQLAPKVEPKQLELVPVQATERTPEPVPEMVQEELESDWSRLYN